MGVTRLQQALARLVGQQDLTLGASDHDGLVRKPDLAPDLLKLILGNQHPDRAELQHHVRHRLPDLAGGGKVGGGPWLAGARPGNSECPAPSV